MTLFWHDAIRDYLSDIYVDIIRNIDLDVFFDSYAFSIKDVMSIALIVVFNSLGTKRLCKKDNIIQLNVFKKTFHTVTRITRFGNLFSSNWESKWNTNERITSQVRVYFFLFSQITRAEEN